MATEHYPYFTLGLDADRPSTLAERIPTIGSRPGEEARFDDAPVKRGPASEKRSDYLPAPELAHAVNSALVLGMPLLVTGPPGTGKTELATAVADELRCPMYKFETKSTSQARDLFYVYDSLNAFKSGQEHDPRGFITYQALGRAILETFDRRRPELAKLLSAGELKAHSRHRSVVLIDEIDKAPRDFPNDLLNEIERLYFRVPELPGAPTSPVAGGYGDIAPNFRPIIIITSNEERGLPPPFLRRCIFFEIQFPEATDMEKIVRKRLTGGRFPDAAIGQAVELFYQLRRQLGGADEGPSTAELLNWLQILGHRGIKADRPLSDQRLLIEQSVTTLLKSGERLSRGLAFLRDSWGGSAP